MSQWLHKPAPDFTLPNQDGRPVRLGDYLGRQPVVLFFYPGDFTPGCTREACAFRDVHAELSQAGVAVFGISADSVEKHKRFKDAYQLPYDLLSDAQEQVAKLYGVGRTFFLKDRVTFVINKEGLVVAYYDSPIFFTRHAQRALEALGLGSSGTRTGDH
ncbi:MAG: peroxiredoxin [Flavobacteriales bacterium]|nr:peroxiredoxin [Flavobacteriales bacterium]MCX7650726.1 peroxiredoxin [Flavobacteriales bacterium]MDW8432673.1 peroxiredoxin [Flavobacteriales bacterium]